VLLDLATIIFLFFFFALSHTLFASTKLKRRIAERGGDKIAFYRLFYNISSLLIFIAIFEIAPKPGQVIYDAHYPYDILIFVLQMFALLGVIWSVWKVDLKEFLGIAQIIRWSKGEYKIDELEERSTFYRNGAFKFSRHPLYFFGILFLGLRSTMDLFYLTLFICVALYFIIGSYYEEKKLVEKFGDEYREYQKKVPRLFPFKIV